MGLDVPGLVHAALHANPAATAPEAAAVVTRVVTSVLQAAAAAGARAVWVAVDGAAHPLKAATHVKRAKTRTDSSRKADTRTAAVEAGNLAALVQHAPRLGTRAAVAAAATPLPPAASAALHRALETTDRQQLEALAVRAWAVTWLPELRATSHDGRAFALTAEADAALSRPPREALEAAARGCAAAVGIAGERAAAGNWARRRSVIGPAVEAAVQAAWQGDWPLPELGEPARPRPPPLLCGVLTAPYDAEALLGALGRAGLLDVVLSNDSDALVFGAPELVRHPQSPEPQAVSAAALLQALAPQWDGTMGANAYGALASWAAMMGCDFVERAAGCGPVTVLALLRGHNWRWPALVKQLTAWPPTAAPSASAGAKRCRGGGGAAKQPPPPPTGPGLPPALFKAALREGRPAWSDEHAKAAAAARALLLHNHPSVAPLLKDIVAAAPRLAALLREPSREGWGAAAGAAGAAAPWQTVSWEALHGAHAAPAASPAH